MTSLPVFRPNRKWTNLDQKFGLGVLFGVDDDSDIHRVIQSHTPEVSPEVALKSRITSGRFIERKHVPRWF